jgi:hypothetical protein
MLSRVHRNIVEKFEKDDLSEEVYTTVTGTEV